MKFPYGLCDFHKIVTQGYFYCDRTDYIPLLEQGDYQLFLRPRRFGKSLLLSMLANYYDVARTDRFEAMFGGLKIGRHPTPLHNQYFVLQWDFSCVDPTGDADDIRRSLYDHINGCINSFVSYYRDYLAEEVEIDRETALYSIQSLITSVRKSGHPIYLLLDEYDNFANAVLMSTRRQGREVYEALVYEDGPLKTLFKVMKSSTKDSIFDRVLMTGVSPVVMSDITSGYNIAEDIHARPSLNELCGFTDDEIAGVVEQVVSESFQDETPEKQQALKNTALTLMRSYYNSHRFAVSATNSMYNPTLALYFLKHLATEGMMPRKLLDSNLATDRAKLRYIATLPGGEELIADLLEAPREVAIPELSERFGIEDILSDRGKDRGFLTSLLYYFGVLTLKGETDDGKLRLAVPNLVMQQLYVDRLKTLLLPNPVERDEGVSAAERLYTSGDMQPLVEFIEAHFFRIFRNPDYRWANELTVKTLFLSLLYNDTLYIMDSEPEVERRYADLTMVIRPDRRRFKVFDVLIEFKYVTLSDLKMSAEQLRKIDREGLRHLPIIQQQMRDARQQSSDYGDALERKYPELRLKRFAVVAVGFERLCWEAVT